MAASEARLRANKINASHSTGPRTEAGKARSRANAAKHGMAGESAEVEAGFSAEFETRRTKWAAEQRPVGEAAEWALDRAVAASLRIERCERALDEVTVATGERARLAWDQDKAVEAATLAGRLADDPVLVTRRLQACLEGVRLLVDAWLGLASKLEHGEDWSETEASRALDLLGVAREFRSDRTMIDATEGAESVGFRLELALEELDRLEALRDESMVPLDEMERRQAMAGNVALLSKSATLVLRYERDAWRRYRESMRQVQALAVPLGEDPILDEGRATPLVPSISPPPGPISPVSPSLDEERRALQAEAAPWRKAVADELAAPGLDLEDDAWLDEYERRIEAMPDVTERTQFGRTTSESAATGTRILHG